MARTLEVNIIQDHHIQPFRTGMLLNRTGLKNGHLPYDAVTEKRYAREPNKMDSARVALTRSCQDAQDVARQSGSWKNCPFSVSVVTWHAKDA
jgi:hypothetical protein